MALFCVISANSGSFRAHCVKVHVRYFISWWVLVTYWHPLCENMTSSTKSEVHNVQRCRQTRTETRPHATRTENCMMFGCVVLEACERTGKQTHANENGDTWCPPGGEVINTNHLHLYALLGPTVKLYVVSSCNVWHLRMVDLNKAELMSPTIGARNDRKTLLTIISANVDFLANVNLRWRSLYAVARPSVVCLSVCL